MLKTVITILLSGAGLLVSAQVPGYLGKKNNLHVTANISPAVKPVNTTSDKGGWNLAYGIGLERAVSRRWTAGVTYRRFVTGMTTGFDNDIEKNYTGGKEYIYEYASNTIEISASRFSLESDFIAPVGRYFCFSAFYVNYALQDKQGHIFEPGKNFYTGYMIGAGLTVGSKMAITKNFLLDYGVGMNYFETLIGADTYARETLKKDLSGNARARVQGAFGAFAKVSVGYLF